MPAVHAFAAVTYSHSAVGRDVSGVVAPPYDVLDSEAKRALLARDARNIVGIDLPHVPPKELGPPEAYAGAAQAMRSLMESGVLSESGERVMFAYRQSFASQDGASTVRRTGMACCVETVPFGARAGGGVLPHEETFSGPKEDRLALMKATRIQLSPIFGLHADQRRLAAGVLGAVVSRGEADRVATTADGTLHEVWTVRDPQTIKEYQGALADEDIFVADGHHRYNTALNYIRWLEESSGGPLPADHAARRCMMVLVGMSDPGLVIWPTHRVLGGMSGYDFERFVSLAGAHARFVPMPGANLREIADRLERAAELGERRFAVYDFKERRGGLAVPVEADPLGASFANQPRAWRDLTVAFIQHVVVERVCQPHLAGGQSVKWAFPHTIAEVEQIGRGAETGAGGGAAFGAGGAQLALLVRPTPLSAVREVSRAGGLMPQKSTYFYPKLATGLFMHRLDG